MTVRRRKDTGNWVSDFYYNGERIIKTLKFARTKKEAEAAEAVIMNQVFQQAYGFEAKPDRRFEDFVIEVVLPYSETNKKSFYDDVLACRVMVEAFKGKTLRQITSPMIEEFKQERLNSNTRYNRLRRPATVNRSLSVLSKIFALAVDSELVDSNPCGRVRKLRTNNERLRVLSTEEETRLFLELDKNELLKQIVTVALHTGLRRGEVFNLKWFDVDFNRALIQVSESKSGKKQLVPMNRSIRNLLNGLKRKSEYVFPSPKTGGKLVDIKKGFRKALANAKIPDFHFHDLRHTAATRMAEAGADAFTLMKILGHSDIRMTARYTHASDSALRRAVENLDVSSQFSNELVTEQKRQALGLP